MKFRKQTVGVDISKDSFDVKFLALPVDGNRFKVRGSRKFPNTRKGLISFSGWVEKKAETGTDLVIAMEATGTYHESLAYFIHERCLQVAILLPNRVKSFARSHNQFSKTDQVDALVIAQMALERSLRLWAPANESSRELRQLTRERQSLIQDRLRHSNQLHALEYAHGKWAKSKRRHEVSINLLDRQVKAIEAEIKELRRQDESLDEAMSRLETIPQVGAITAATVLAETGSFNLFESRSQVVKYAGMDIIERQSGSSIRGKGRLSKRGNSRLRGALHMPAIGVINRDGPFKELYLRILERTKCKMKAVVAVQRKLLVVMYALTKNEQDYDLSIHQLRIKGVGEHEGPPTVTQSAKASWS